MKKIVLMALLLVPYVFVGEEAIGEMIQSDYNSSGIAETATSVNSSKNDETKIKSALRSLAFCLTENKWYNNEISRKEILETLAELDPWGFTHESFVKINNDMQLNEGETLAAHNAHLSNNSGIEQTMYTAAFDHTQTDSVSTKTSRTSGTETSTSVDMSFPLGLGSASISLKVSHEFNTTKEVVSSTTKKWTVPSQPIKVPAGRQYTVNWLLKTGVATGTTKLTSLVKGWVPFKIVGDTRYAYSVGDAITTQKNLYNLLGTKDYRANWSYQSNWEPDGSAGLRTKANATYTAKYGTQLIMNIVDVTNIQANKNARAAATPVLVESIPLDIVPDIVE